ncbi:c-type cytochrome [Xanthovirga aplysinae]|uniref:c-type cytochrome n=1 Tax=Xanthovirga aplysinae TaxID=2529853 RepID=UPI0012BBC75A|nr:cytochrome c [Xanthovirga aplysinae]MTI29418.1 cytochrome c [Xanthovirga aplysinae]
MRKAIVIIIPILLLFTQTACKKSGDKAADSNKKEGLSRREQIKFKQYMTEGRRLYIANCANCHQKDGKGLARLIPPLAESDYMAKNVERTICIIKNGLEGEILVNGISYNQPMPAHTNLTNIEIAEIVTYIHNSWGSFNGIVDVKDVEKTTCD